MDELPCDELSIIIACSLWGVHFLVEWLYFLTPLPFLLPA